MKTIRVGSKKGGDFMPEHEDYAIDSVNGKSQASHVVDEMKQDFIPPSSGIPISPIESIETSLSEIQNNIREQQMMVEQNLQDALNKASTHVSDSHTIDTLLALSQQVASIVSQGHEQLQSNSQHIKDLLNQLGNQLSMQQTKTDRHVAQSLQKAVCCLADAQNAIFQSMSISDMGHYVKEANQTLQEVRNSEQIQ